MTGRLPASVLLAYGVRQIFTPTTGRRIRDVQQLKDGGSYVCAGFETFKPMNYGQSSVAAFVGMYHSLVVASTTFLDVFFLQKRVFCVSLVYRTFFFYIFRFCFFRLLFFLALLFLVLHLLQSTRCARELEF